MLLNRLHQQDWTFVWYQKTLLQKLTIVQEQKLDGRKLKQGKIARFMLASVLNQTNLNIIVSSIHWGLRFWKFVLMNRRFCLVSRYSKQNILNIQFCKDMHPGWQGEWVLRLDIIIYIIVNFVSQKITRCVVKYAFHLQQLI